MSYLSAGLEIGGSLLGFAADYQKSEDIDDMTRKQIKEERRVAEENRTISLYDASVAEKDAFEADQSAAVALSQHMLKTDRVMGTMMAKLGKSGVALGEGSALDVVVRTAQDAAKDADLIVHNGKTAASRRRSLATRYKYLAKKGLRDAAAHATLIEDAGASASRGYMWSGAGKLAQGAADFAEIQGWF